jgi:hypothetical protein
MFDSLASRNFAQVSPLLACRPGWRVSEHPSGMLIWRSPAGRHYVCHPVVGRAGSAEPHVAGSR